MCFTSKYKSKSGLRRTKKVAEIDIVCYKYLDEHLDNTEKKKKRYTAPCFERFSYENKVLVKSDLVMRYYEGEFVTIGKGLHSFVNIEVAKNYEFDFNEDSQLYQFIIPKGSIYYENSVHFVSNQIIKTGVKIKI